MSAEEKTYLELSEAGEGAHKFYEVTVAGKKLTIRFGRIGDAGQSSTKAFPSEAAAHAEATKKLGEKQRKGYEAAVPGLRQKRAVARRNVSSQASTAKQAPVLWKFNSGMMALGIYIDDARCWIGNQAGQVVALDHSGKVERQFKLPDGVMALVGDDVWMYAGCDDGNVYDLNGRAPRVAYEIAGDEAIDWLDIWDGVLAVSTVDGGLTTIDPENQSLWSRTGPGGGAWTVRLDRAGVYHGHGGYVTAYTLAAGKQRWRTKTGMVLFGWQTDKAMYVGTGKDEVVCLAKKDGKKLAAYACDDTILSCATAPEGKFVYGGDGHSSIYCFDAKGKRLWKLGTDCGSALSMQYWNEQIFIVTTSGYLACIDASEAAIRAAEEGTLPTTRDIKAPTKGEVAATNKVESTSSSKQGVMLECVEDGGKVRVHVVTPGYHREWYVQFPRGVREPGARYIVDEVRESARGGFYRAYGDIKKLVPVSATRKKR